jgi:glycosyltransferase involved in cell wall biosynthesis
MRAMVEADRLGAIADPEDHEDLARALREILEQPRPDYEAMRERCLTVSRERYAWEVVVRPYLALVDRLTTPSDAGVRAA